MAFSFKDKGAKEASSKCKTKLLVQEEPHFKSESTLQVSKHRWKNFGQEKNVACFPRKVTQPRKETTEREIPKSQTLGRRGTKLIWYEFGMVMRRMGQGLNIGEG